MGRLYKISMMGLMGRLYRRYTIQGRRIAKLKAVERIVRVQQLALHWAIAGI